jgi:hypothetical protein
MHSDTGSGSGGNMAGGRTPQETAKRALILGTIAFRASLEITDHPRVVEISGRLLPWLVELGCEDGFDSTERELLATPLGQLSDSQRIDANWAGEAAAVLCWMLNLAAPLEVASGANQSDLPAVLCILKPEAAKILRSASLRDRMEIEEACRQFVLIRSMLQESRLDRHNGDIIRRVNVQRLDDVGLAVSEDAIRRASEAVSRMTPEERGRAPGLYLVRDRRVGHRWNADPGPQRHRRGHDFAGFRHLFRGHVSREPLVYQQPVRRRLRISTPGRGDVGFDAPLINPVSLMHDSATLIAPDWKLFQLEFIAVGPMTRIIISSNSNPGDPHGGIIIDAASAVPEPTLAWGAILAYLAWRRPLRFHVR